MNFDQILGEKILMSPSQLELVEAFLGARLNGAETWSADAEQIEAQGYDLETLLELIPTYQRIAPARRAYRVELRTEQRTHQRMLRIFRMVKSSNGETASLQPDDRRAATTVSTPLSRLG